MQVKDSFIGLILKTGDMEQIVNSFLKQQGVEYIGSFDKENNVWIYIKDGEIHFCKSDLTPINKENLGLENDLLILTETAGCIHKIDENKSFSNFIVIDDSNKILVRIHFGECDNSSERGKDSYLLKRVNQDTFFLVSELYLESCCLDDKDTAIHSLFSWDTGYKNYSYLFKENKYMKNHHLGSYYQDFYIFKNVVDYTLTLINCGNGRILDKVEYGEWFPCLWIHADAKAQIVIVKNDSDHVNNGMDSQGNTIADNKILSGAVTIIELEHWLYTYNYIVSDYMLPSDISYDNTELDYNYFEKPYNFLHSDDSLVLPFLKKYGAFVVNYLGDRFTAHSIVFDDYSEYFKIELHGKLLHLYDSHTIYDIYGNKLGSFENRDNNFCVFSDKRSLLNSTYNEEVKGVIGIWSNKIVVPPIFKEIGIIDDENGLFEVTYRINGENMQKVTKGLYSADEGFLIPFGTEYEYPEYYNNVLDKRTFNTRTINKFIIFTIGEKYGLIYKGRIVLEANYDWISGFCFWDDFKEEPNTSFYLWDEATEIEQKTKDYSPLCVILREHGKLGLFCEIEYDGNKNYEVVEPDYDNITFVKVFGKHTYFKVERNGKVGIISDNLSFNKQNELIYDEVAFKAIIEDKCFFTVSKEGKEGAICTNEHYNMPNIFDKIDTIVRSGVICNNILYNRNGEQIFSLDKYYYIKTRHYDVFKSTESDDFVFIDPIGNTVSYEKDEDDEKILHVSGTKESFDIEEENFIEEEEDYYYDYNSDYTQEELDEMYRAAYEGDPEAQWNTD